MTTHRPGCELAGLTYFEQAGMTCSCPSPTEPVLSDLMPRLWQASELKPTAQPIWLAKGRIPRSAVTILVGDEGIGKSLLWVWIVAAVTTGNPLPEFGIPPRAPATVVLVLTEDEWSYTVRPRLEVAGADLDFVLVMCTEEDGSGSPVFPRDLDLIEQHRPRPVLVVIDAWLDTVPSRISVKDPQQARQALHPMKELATTTEAAVLLLTHTNRVGSGSARDKYGATGELRKKARMTLFAQLGEDGELLVGPEKMNTTQPLPASRFLIDSVQHFPPSEDDDGTVPRLRYVGQSALTAREHVQETYDAEHGEGAEDRSAAEDWLSDYLKDKKQTGAPSVKCKEEAKKAGFSERSIQRASKTLKVHVRSSGFPRTTWWYHPDCEPVAPLEGPSISDGATGATGATDSDLQVSTGATGSQSRHDTQSRQSRHPKSNGTTDGATVRPTHQSSAALQLSTPCHSCRQPNDNPDSLLCGPCLTRARERAS